MSTLSQWMADPIIQSAVAPFLVAAILTGLLGFGLGKPIGHRVAAAAIPAGFLASYWATIGWPSFPPVSSTQKIFFIAILGTIVGAILNAIRANDGTERFAMVQGVWIASIVGWLGWKVPFLDASGTFTLAWLGYSAQWISGVFTLLALIGTGAVGTLFLWLDRRNGACWAVMLMMAAIGVSFIALLGSSASYAQLSGGLAAATGGFLLWNWPKDRFSLGWAAFLGGSGALIALVSSLALFTTASKLALALILPVFFCSRLAARLPLAANPVIAPFILAAVCLVPVGIAVLVAYLSSGGGSGYAAGAGISVS